MSTEQLFSRSWYRAAGVVPRLRSHIRIHRHTYRDDIVYVLEDSISGRLHRFNPAANLLIGLMDGQRDLRTLWTLTCERLKDAAPTQDDVIDLVARLHRADVLQADFPPDMAELGTRGEAMRQMIQRAKWKSPLAIKFPLLDPDRLLNALAPLCRLIFSRAGFVVWLVTVGAAVIGAGMHWQELGHDILGRALSMENILLAGLIFPFLKAWHEFGHACAIKRWGGETHEMGIMLLVLFPVPYVDASTASGFADKRSRIAVGAAGMLFETFVAALAFFVWVTVEPGVVRGIAYNVMLIAGLSTVIFNGNPLLRYDGYYIFKDLIEVPDLGPRANQYWGYLINRYLFGVGTARSPVLLKGERRWFITFGPASFVYRMFVMLTIVFAVASQYFIVGVILAIWAALFIFIWPSARYLRYIATSPGLRGRRLRAVCVAGAFVAAICGLLLIPVPSVTLAEGIVWIPDEAHVRPLTHGIVKDVPVAHGAPVKRGDLLVVLEDPRLEAEHKVLQAQSRELLARLDAMLSTNRVQADVVREELAHIQTRLQSINERLAGLSVRSPVDGYFLMPERDDGLGRFVRRGQRIGYVADFASTTIRVVIPQAAVGRVREATDAVALRSIDTPRRALSGRILREVPGATAELPSLALAAEGGGTLSLDPAQQGAPKALTTQFVFDLTTEPGALGDRFGGRVYARFEHPAESLFAQAERELRQLFLRHFSV